MPDKPKAKAFLTLEVMKLNEFKDSIPHVMEGWEGSYKDWPVLAKSVSDFLDAYAHRELEESDKSILLYVLARDYEFRTIQSELKVRPFHLLSLAEYGVNYGEVNARWQLADALGYMPPNNVKAEKLLETYFYDVSEYVGRWALDALCRRNSPKAERFAREFWESNNTYKQMTVLQALRLTTSSLFREYLSKALTDVRPELAEFANKINKSLQS